MGMRAQRSLGNKRLYAPTLPASAKEGAMVDMSSSDISALHPLVAHVLGTFYQLALANQCTADPPAHAIGVRSASFQDPGSRIQDDL